MELNLRLKPEAIHQSSPHGQEGWQPLRLTGWLASAPGKATIELGRSRMIRYLISIIIIGVSLAASGSLFFPTYWEHRYDELIARQARVFRLDEKLVWSLIYEETWFRSWKIGADAEVGLMQVTPLVAREWAKETGFKEYEQQATENVNEFLADPERNMQVGCWYLERLREKYRGWPAETAMTLAAYNAGPSRVDEWTRDAPAAQITEAEFIDRIGIASTKNYVSSILTRYRKEQTKAE